MIVESFETGPAATNGYLVGDEQTREAVAIVDLLFDAGLAPSKSQARRLIAQGGAYVDDTRADDGDRLFSPAALRAGVLLRAGKKRYARAVLRPATP